MGQSFKEGHEATQVGSSIALKQQDWIFPLYQDATMVLARGISAVDLINRYLGNSKDPMKGHDLPNPTVGQPITSSATLHRYQVI